MASISTAMPPGKALVPSALRAAIPRSGPKTSANNWLQPLITCGCWSNSSVESTSPSSLTTMDSISYPSVLGVANTANRSIWQQPDLAQSTTPCPTAVIMCLGQRGPCPESINCPYSTKVCKVQLVWGSGSQPQFGQTFFGGQQ